MEDVLAQSKTMRSEGKALDEVLSVLREEGYSRTEAIKLVMQMENVSLAEAKRMVHFSDTWSDVREDAEDFHAAFTDALKEEQRS